MLTDREVEPGIETEGYRQESCLGINPLLKNRNNVNWKPVLVHQ